MQQLCVRVCCKMETCVSVQPSCAVLAPRTGQGWAAQEELVQIYMDRGLEEDLARRVRHMLQAALPCDDGKETCLSCCKACLKCMAWKPWSGIEHPCKSAWCIYMCVA